MWIEVEDFPHNSVLRKPIISIESKASRKSSFHTILSYGNDLNDALLDEEILPFHTILSYGNEDAIETFVMNYNGLSTQFCPTETGLCLWDGLLLCRYLSTQFCPTETFYCEPGRRGRHPLSTQFCPTETWHIRHLLSASSIFFPHNSVLRKRDYEPRVKVAEGYFPHNSVLRKLETEDTVWELKTTFHTILSYGNPLLPVPRPLRKTGGFPHNSVLRKRFCTSRLSSAFFCFPHNSVLRKPGL